MMTEEQHTVRYGVTTIQYELTYSSRKTLAISVHPDLRVTVDAPEGTPFAAIEVKVRKRARWILKQQRELEKYLPHLPPKQYISGESHRYLGKQYRLKVIQADYEQVKLTRGQIEVYTLDKRDIGYIQEQLEAWYLWQARRVFRQRLREMFKRFHTFAIEMPELQIRALKARWGSCTPSGKIILNVKLMQVPKQYIDYVLVHELCHLIEHNHSKRFYLLLDSLMPDWKERRRELNEVEFR